MGGGFTDHLRVARLFALDGALQSFIKFREQGADGFVRCLAFLFRVLGRGVPSVRSGKGGVLSRCFGSGCGLLLRSRFAVFCRKHGWEGCLLRFGEGGAFFGERLGGLIHRCAEFHNIVNGQPARVCRRAGALFTGGETGRFIQQRTRA